MAILNNNPLIGSGGNQGYNINNSVRLRSSASAYLSRTPASAGNRKTWTWSAWVKRGALGSNQSLFSARPQSGAGFTFLRFVSDTNPDTITFADNNGASLVTSALHRDVAAWYHIVLSVDTTQATASNRVRIYVNGNQVTAFSTATYPSQNLDMSINNNINHWLANNSDGAGSLINFFDGYMAEVNFIDGQAKVASDFGETDTTTGVWKPKAYSGTYGTNGFYLKFSDIATTSGSNAGLGKDFSGNTNYWTTNNISVTSGTTYDAMTDSPTLTSATVANYCTLNPLTFAGTVSEANLRAASAGTDYKILGTLGVSSGKWYWEFIANNAPGGDVYGVANLLTPTSPTDTTSLSVAGTFARVNTGTQWYENGTLLSKSISTVSAGGIIQFALDVDNLKIWVGINGTWQASGDPAAGTNPISSNLTSGQTWFPYLQFRSATSNISANFGQRPFSYTPPTGFVALNTFNLPTPTILQGNKYMDATLATGNNSTQVITNAAGFRPDFVWLKIRSGVENHIAYDSVRGAQQYLVPNLTLAEATLSSGLTSFNSNGFTLGNANPNYSGSPTFVAWQWQAGQGSTSSNTSGSITSTVSVNTTAGFSVVTYTGTGANATVGHGLGVAPRMIICKNRASATDWAVYHASVGNTGALRLNLTAVTETDSRYWNNTTPTSTVFSIGSSSTVNGSSNTQVAYCWAEIAGFSRFGSYTGNGSTDGTFVYTGFRPEFIMFKRTNDVSDWNILDTTRSPYNTSITRLFANSSNAENSSAGNYDIDILSNGFKQRNTNTSTASNSNLNGSTYIFMAFAENPFKNSLAR